MKRHFLAIVLALLIGVPLGWVLAMMMTPVLWRLEPVLHMELAGHFGPSDWIFYVVWAVVVPVLFLLIRFVFLARPAKNT